MIFPFSIFKIYFISKQSFQLYLYKHLPFSYLCVRTKLNFGWQLFIKSKTCLDAVNLLKYYINRCKSPKEKCPSDYLQSTKLSQVQITYRKSLKCADTTINLRSVKNLTVLNSEIYKSICKYFKNITWLPPKFKFASFF